MNQSTLQELVDEAFPAKPDDPDSTGNMMFERSLSEALAVNEFYRLVADVFPSD